VYFHSLCGGVISILQRVIRRGGCAGIRSDFRQLNLPPDVFIEPRDVKGRIIGKLLCKTKLVLRRAFRIESIADRLRDEILSAEDNGGISPACIERVQLRRLKKFSVLDVELSLVADRK